MALELVKKDIRMTKSKGTSMVQITLDDDFNVPDIKPDIMKIIQERAEIKVNHIETQNDRVKVQGDLDFTVLYLTDSDQKPVHSMTGTQSFEEVINLDGIVEQDEANVTAVIENLAANMINSRKISVKAILGLKALVEEEYEVNVATDIGGGTDIQRIHQPIRMSQVFANKRDTYRVRDEVALPGSKPNIMEILWTNASIRNPEIRLLDDKISIKGEMALFVLYMGEDEDKPVEFVEFELPFNGVIECDGCLEEMVGNITMDIITKDIQIRPDLDGEERLLDVEIISELGIKVFEQVDVDLLKDVYSPSNDISLHTKPVMYENVLMKNQTQCKVNEKVAINSGDPYILQICYADGEVKIDDIEMIEDGIEVEGIVLARILYVAADDKIPINVIREMIPFKHHVDVKDINQQCTYQVKPSIDYVTCNMLDDQEVEIRCGINLSTMVFNQQNKEVITDLEVSAIDMKRVQDLPSIVGYIVKKGDNLWDIAKRYYTTIERIQTINNLSDNDTIKAGDKLVIVKNVNNII